MVRRRRREAETRRLHSTSHLNGLHSRFGGMAEDIWRLLPRLHGSGPEYFRKYLVHHEVDMGMPFSTFPGRTVPEVKAALALAGKFSQFVVQAPDRDPIGPSGRVGPAGRKRPAAPAPGSRTGADQGPDQEPGRGSMMRKAGVRAADFRRRIRDWRTELPPKTQTRVNHVDQRDLQGNVLCGYGDDFARGRALVRPLPRGLGRAGESETLLAGAGRAGDRRGAVGGGPQARMDSEPRPQPRGPEGPGRAETRAGLVPVRVPAGDGQAARRTGRPGRRHGRKSCSRRPTCS